MPDTTRQGPERLHGIFPGRDNLGWGRTSGGVKAGSGTDLGPSERASPISVRRISAPSSRESFRMRHVRAKKPNRRPRPWIAGSAAGIALIVGGGIAAQAATADHSRPAKPAPSATSKPAPTSAPEPTKAPTSVPEPTRLAPSSPPGTPTSRSTATQRGPVRQ